MKLIKNKLIISVEPVVGHLVLDNGEKYNVMISHGSYYFYKTESHRLAVSREDIIELLEGNEKFLKYLNQLETKEDGYETKN